MKNEDIKTLEECGLRAILIDEDTDFESDFFKALGEQLVRNDEEGCVSPMHPLKCHTHTTFH